MSGFLVNHIYFDFIEHLHRRVPPVDVIVMKAGSQYSTWEDLVKADKAVVGTSAVRRIAQLQGKYPNLTFTDIRGNLNTRLKKLDDPEGSYDAIILAKAGIMRLDWHHRIHRVNYSYHIFRIVITPPVYHRNYVLMSVYTLLDKVLLP